MNINIVALDVVDSTNDEAARQARLGATEGLCVVAREQTAGRGRHGRTWASEPDSGLYFSIVLRPQLEPDHLPLITLMAGVAVHDALEELGLDADIKWVNDILVGEKKISGILAETAETPVGLAVILGIGVNLASTNFPSDIASRATSIEAEIGLRPTADEFAQFLVKYITYFYGILCEEKGPAAIIAHWRQRSSYYSGKLVRVTTADTAIEGTTDGLEASGALRVITADGRLHIVQAGDVERLRSRS